MNDEIEVVVLDSLFWTAQVSLWILVTMLTFHVFLFLFALSQ